MADYDVTDEINALTQLGYTSAELEMRIRWLRHHDGRWLAGGRSCQERVLRLFDEARERAARQQQYRDVAAGRVCSWRNVSGTWVICGVDLHERDIVTVLRADGTSSLEVVGHILSHLPDGTMLAKVGAL